MLKGVCIMRKKTKRLISVFLSIFILSSLPVVSSISASAEVTGLRTGETYYLRNAATGKYMDVYNAGRTNGTNVTLYAFNGQTNQRFTIVHKGNNVYKLRPKHASGYTLDVTNSNIDIWQEGNYSYQDFTIVRNVSSQLPGTYYIKFGSKYVMSNANEDNVVVADTSSYDSKALWSFEKVTHGDAYIFGTRYNNGNESFDTTAMDAEILNCVNNRMGYYGETNINPSKDSVMEALETSDILLINSHSNAGEIGLYNGSGALTGTLYASDINALPANKLTSLRVFIASGCNTGNTTSSGDNLVNSAFARGAHFAIGWTESIHNDTANHWNKSFFDKIGDGGATVSEALAHAEYWASCGSYYRKGDLKQQLSHIS